MDAADALALAAELAADAEAADALELAADALFDADDALADEADAEALCEALDTEALSGASDETVLTSDPHAASPRQHAHSTATIIVRYFFMTFPFLSLPLSTRGHCPVVPTWLRPDERDRGRRAIRPDERPRRVLVAVLLPERRERDAPEPVASSELPDHVPLNDELGVLSSLPLPEPPKRT